MTRCDPESKLRQAQPSHPSGDIQMTTRTAETSPLTLARVAGLLYLMGLPAPFGLIYVPSRLIVSGDAAATAANNMALLMVMFVVAGDAIAMLNEMTQFAVLRLLSGADYLTVFTTDLVQALALLFLNMHSQGINIAQIFWGLWLLPMGYLVFKSGFLPRIIGALLIIAGFGYVIQSFAAVLGYNLSIIFYTGWGELLLLLWLLIKGVNVEQWNKRAAESA